MSTWFYGDPHYGHANIIRYASRPFGDVTEMDSIMAERYRACIQAQDLVIWLGDCAFGATARDLVASLPGRRILIKGNHDGSRAQAVQMGFEEVYRESNLWLDGIGCRLNHFPYATPESVYWDKFKGRRPPRIEGEVLIHGHTHQTQPEGPVYSVNVGVDAWGFRPVGVDDVAQLVRKVY